jgi:hypothetical protein
VMKARAKESRGQGTADADVTMLLSGENGGTAATVTTEVQLSGKVATMGQGVLQDVSGRLVRTFAENLAAMLGGGETPAAPVAAPGEPPAPAQPREPPPEPADALDLGSIGGAVIAARLRDPRVLAGVIAAAALAGYLAGRRR